MSAHIGKCSIISCENFQGSATASPGIDYFKVPSMNTTEGKKWMVALKNELVNYSGSFVCSVHFHKSDIMMRRIKGIMYIKLKDDAVPRLKLSNDDSAMDVDTANQDEEMIQYVDIEAIKKAPPTPLNCIGRKSAAPIIIIQPQLSTERNATKTYEIKKLENSNAKASKCDLCTINLNKFRQANERCRRLEEVNQNLNEQIKYLLEKIRLQEKTVTQTDKNDTIKATKEIQSDQNEPMTNQSQSNDESISNLNEDGPSDDLNVDCTTAPEKPTTNDPQNKPKKKRKRPPKARGIPKNATLKLDVVPLNSTFFKCGICVESVSFATPAELDFHMKENHLKTKQRQISFENKEQISSKKSSFECYICKLNLNKLSEARKHIKGHVLVRSEKCDVCNEKCTAKELNWHMCGSAEKRIQCEYCTKSFGAIVKLIQHIDAEHEAEKIQHRCDKCSRFFGTISLRDLHETHHEVVDKLHVCQICEKAFSRVDGLSAHLNRHSVKRRDYLCSVCGKGFLNASVLKSHTATHSGKTVKCPDCPLVFLNKTKMSYHRDTHMDSKFKCNLCSSILGTRTMLAKHIRFVHQMTEEDKKYACTFCSFRFVKSDKLKIHMRKHTGEKPYVCEYCDRRYAYQQDFKKHLRTHVGDNIYKCEICDKGFLLHRHLNKHLLEHYKEERLKKEFKETQKDKSNKNIF